MCECAHAYFINKSINTFRLFNLNLSDLHNSTYVNSHYLYKTVKILT